MTLLNAVYLYQLPSKECTRSIKILLYYYFIALRSASQRSPSGSTSDTFQQQGQQNVLPNVKLQLSEQRVVCYVI